MADEQRKAGAEIDLSGVKDPISQTEAEKISETKLPEGGAPLTKPEAASATESCAAEVSLHSSPVTPTTNCTTQSHSTAPSSPTSDEIGAKRDAPEKTVAPIKSKVAQGEGLPDNSDATSPIVDSQSEKGPQSVPVSSTCEKKEDTPISLAGAPAAPAPPPGKVATANGSKATQPSAQPKQKNVGKVEEVTPVAEPHSKDHEDSKQKKQEAGPAARLPSLLNKNRSREDLEAENSALRKELNSLRKKLTESLDDNDSLRAAIGSLTTYATKAKWSTEQCQLITKFLTAKDRKGKRDDQNTESLLGVSGARGPRRRQGRKKKTGKRSHSETQVRRSASQGDGDSEASVSDESIERDIDPSRKAMLSRHLKRKPQDIIPHSQQIPRLPHAGRGGGANRRRERDVPDERRKQRGRRQDVDRQPMWVPKVEQSYRGKMGNDEDSQWDKRGRSTHTSPEHETADPESELIRSSLRNATSVAELEDAISKAQGKKMTYETHLGNRKLQRMKAG